MRGGRGALLLALAGCARAQEVQVEQLSSSKDGYDTYRVAVGFDPETTLDVYALYGEPGDPLIIPPAFQVAAPFGSNVGPVSLLPCFDLSIEKRRPGASNGQQYPLPCCTHFRFPKCVQQGRGKKKFLEKKKFWKKKIFGKKKFLEKNNFWKKKIFGKKKFLEKKNFWKQKNLETKKFGNKKIWVPYGSKFELLTFFN